ncbi:MAG TPA: hypothetical protein VLD67_12220 [Vicinamibacterales bacterium]|nr:hypothetical protein [Vicinamibacterales bacterium]
MNARDDYQYPAGLPHADPPCLSLYQPTHRHYPDTQQDPIRFRNLVRVLEESLREKYPSREIRPLLEPFHALAADFEFWNHLRDGLAVLGAPGTFRVYRLQRRVPELAVVADSFHTKPLLRILQSADRYQILGVTRQSISLCEGNRDVLDEVPLASGVPRTITDALGEQLTEPHITVASYGGAGGPAMRHGHGSKKDEVEADTERFFRVVDKAVLHHHSRPSGLPLILAALPEHQALFRRVTHNTHLVDGGVDVNPQALSIDELRLRAWEAVEPHYVARLAALVEEFGTARSKGLGSDEPAEVCKAAVAGRVAAVLIEAERQVPGRIDPESGSIEPGELSRPEVDDVLDDLGEMVLRAKGRVVIVPADRMPSDTGVAAIYRF